MAEPIEPPLTVTFAAPTGDKIATDVRAVAKHFGLAESEAVAMIMGFGIAEMTHRGMIPGRSSRPMGRAQFAREMRDMAAQAEEFE